MEPFVEVLWKKGSPMSEKTIQLNGVKSTRKQRVGRVTIYLRGKIWYLYYCDRTLVPAQPLSDFRQTGDCGV